MVEGPTLKHIDTRDSGNAVSGATPRVGVLMSTYNGERYLREQIETIAAQKGVVVRLFVRDDGSSDMTRTILGDLAQKPLGCIDSWEVELGENVGFLLSFEKLLMNVTGCDYYAFSDQDDFWLPEKLERAVYALQSSDSSLYASAVEITDEELTPVGRNDFPGLVYSIPGEVIRHRLSGHNMVWVESLQRRLAGLGPLPCWSHDQHVVLAGLLAGDDLVFDSASYVRHRRLRNSVTPGGAGLAKRMRHELRMLWNPGLAWDRAALAKAILELHDGELFEADRCFLVKCAEHKRLSLVTDVSFDCGLRPGNFEAQLSVLLGRF